MLDNSESLTTIQLIWAAVRELPEILKHRQLRDKLDKGLRDQPFEKNIFNLAYPVDSPYFANLLIIFRELEKQNISIIVSSELSSSTESILRHFLNSPELQTQLNDLLHKAKHEFQTKIKKILSQSEKDEIFVVEAKFLLNEVASKLPTFWNTGLIIAQEIKIFWGAYQYLIKTNFLSAATLSLDIPILRLYQIDSADCLENFLNFLEKRLTLSAALQSAESYLQKKRDLLQKTLQVVWSTLSITNLIDESIEKALNVIPFDRKIFSIQLETFKNRFYSNLSKFYTKTESSSIDNNKVLRAIAILEEILTSDKSLIRLTEKVPNAIRANSLPNEIWELILVELAQSSPEHLDQLIQSPDFMKIWKSLENKLNLSFKTKKIFRDGIWKFNKEYVSHFNFNPNDEIIYNIIECENGCLVSSSFTREFSKLMQWSLNDEDIYVGQQLSYRQDSGAFNRILELKNETLVCADIDGIFTFFSYNKDKNTYTLREKTNLKQGPVTALFELPNGSIISFSEQSSILVHTYFDSRKDRYMQTSNHALGCTQLKDGSLMVIQAMQVVSMMLNTDGVVKQQQEKKLPFHGNHVNLMIELLDNSLVFVTDDKLLSRWVYNSNDHKFEKTHTGKADESIEKIIQLENGSLLTSTSVGTITCWVLNDDTQEFKIKQVLQHDTGRIGSLIQLQDKSLLCGAANGRLILWKLNSQHNFFSKPIYLSETDSANALCQLRNGSFIVGNRGEALKHYTYETLNEIFNEIKVLLNVNLKSALQKNQNHSMNVNFLNTPDPLEKQKSYLRTVLSKLPSILIGHAYIQEQEIKIFLGAYQYLVFKDAGLQTDDSKLKQFVKLMEFVLALPVFALYKNDKTCLQAFADFLLQEKNLQPIFDEAKLYFSSTKSTLGNM